MRRLSSQKPALGRKLMAIKTAAEAIREALEQAMVGDERVLVIGEGVPDPKGIFGTTVGLREKFGDKRVFDMPVSENGLTGVVIGAALSDLRPVLTHQRVDFALYSLDQIINNAAKWKFMFGQSVPVVIRMVIGRGWGQGAQHSQNLQALFAHIPGLQVVMPATAYDAKGLMMASIASDDPVVFLEHRWIHGLKGEVPTEEYAVPLGQANRVREGKDISVIASSYMTIEALRAVEVLEQAGVGVDLIDLRTIKPVDEKMILESVKKTGRLLVVDSGWATGGVAGEIMARVSEKVFDNLKQAPRRVTLPDSPAPSSPALTKGFYKTWRDIARVVGDMMKIKESEMSRLIASEEKKITTPHDVPDASFTGPF